MAIKIQCPNPEHTDSEPSFAIYPNGGFCFGCQYRLTPQEMAKAGIDITQNRPRTAQRTESRPSMADIQWYARALTKGPLRERLDWFYSRGFSHRTIEDNLFGHNGTDFVIPLWYDGHYVGVQYRRDDKYDPEGRRPKYRTPKGEPTTTFRSDLHSRSILIPEGPLDAALLRQYGYSICGTSGGAGRIPSAVTKELWHERRRIRLYVCTDLDEPGHDAFEGIARNFPNVYRVIWPAGKDVTDALQLLEPLERGVTLQRWIQDSEEYTCAHKQAGSTTERKSDSTRLRASANVI